MLATEWSLARIAASLNVAFNGSEAGQRVKASREEVSLFEFSLALLIMFQQLSDHGERPWAK